MQIVCARVFECNIELRREVAVFSSRYTLILLITSLAARCLHKIVMGFVMIIRKNGSNICAVPKVVAPRHNPFTCVDGRRRDGLRLLRLCTTAGDPKRQFEGAFGVPW